MVNSAVHKTKTVSGTDDGITTNIKNRAFVNCNAFEITTELAPRIG